jgi:hypothetical protein
LPLSDRFGIFGSLLTNGLQPATHKLPATFIKRPSEFQA